MYEGRNVHFTTNNKPLCSFSGKLCNLRRLNGYAFCVRHILEDPSAPFKQCAFMVKTSGMRCTSAIPRGEDRQYCNSHMQVMGIIPKKERRKKIESPFLSDGSDMQSLETFKPPNGYSTEDRLNSHSFSASKMFPELAGKLSLDNQKSCDRTTADVSSSMNKPLSKQSAVSGASSKRSRKPTRKHLSILKKKQLGLLTEEEARASLTTLGCKAYNHYSSARLSDSQLLTPLVDSSDDEGFSSPLLLTHTLRTSRSSVSSPSNTDLNNELSSGSDSESEGVLRLKRACLQLGKAALLNQQATDYNSKLTSHMIDTVTDNLSCAVVIAKNMRPLKISSKVSSSLGESRSHVDSSVVDSSQRCTYSDEKGRRCTSRPIPLTHHCCKHITHSGEQKLFTACTFSHVHGEDGSPQTCGLPAIDTGQGTPLCQRHLPSFVDPFDHEQDLNLRKKKKKSKPFALRRPKKRKKVVKPQKPLPSTSDTSAAAGISSGSEISVGVNKLSETSKSGSSSLAKAEEDEMDTEDEDILSPLDKSLLPLGHDDSKILDDNEINEVLNEEDFILFQGGDSDKNDDGLDLTQEEADLLFSGGGDDLLNDLKGELPDDITDAILHVEYEEEIKKQQQQQRQQQMPLQVHNVQQTAPQPAVPPANHRLLQQSASMYEMTGHDGYGDGDYHPMHQHASYNHQGPPPDYPGATKLVPTAHLNVHNNLDYMHEQTSRYSHHQIHPKIATSANNPQMLHRQSSYHLPPTSPLSMSASSNHLNSNPMPMNRMGRLPPVSTITMQPWLGNESPASAPYQNGFQSPAEHHLYQHNNGLPSPPHYQSPREHRLMYANSLYNNGAYGMNRSLPPHAQRVNMPMQQ